MDQPRILHVSAYYPPHMGGQEVAVQELAAQLASAGERVAVVTSDIGGRRGSAVESGIRVTRLKGWEVGRSAVIPGLFWWLIRNARRDTLVHLHFGQVFTPEIVWLASKIIGFKYIFHVHCDPEPSGPLGKLLPIYRKLFSGRELRDAAQVIVLNDGHRRTVGERSGRYENVTVMRNGVRSEFFCTPRRPNESGGDHPSSGFPMQGAEQVGPNRPMELVFVGRLSPHKNLDCLIKALEVAKTKVTLHVIGDGECGQALEEAARAVHTGNVVFHGRLSRDEIMRFYASCDGFVMPSIYEAQGLALLEAMACGMPAIASNTVASGELTDCTIAVDPSVEGLAAGIDRLADMPLSARVDLAERGFRRAEDHEWSRVLDSYINLYSSIYSAGPRSDSRRSGRKH